MADPSPQPDRDLLAYLAEHDLPCPHCGYNLRQLTKLTCPECGRPITIDGVTHSRRPVWPFIIAVIAFSVSLIESVRYWMYLINFHDMPSHGSMDSGALAPLWRWGSRIFWYGQAPLLLALLAFRSLFIRWPVKVQIAIAFVFAVAALTANRRHFSFYYY